MQGHITYSWDYCSQSYSHGTHFSLFEGSSEINGVVLACRQGTKGLVQEIIYRNSVTFHNKPQALQTRLNLCCIQLCLLKALEQIILETIMVIVSKVESKTLNHMLSYNQSDAFNNTQDTLGVPIIYHMLVTLDKRERKQPFFAI